VAETARLSSVDKGCRVLGPGRSRFRFSSIGDETVAAAALRGNKSSRALPRPGGALLQCCRRARGGGAPFVEPLYRRPAPVLLCLRRVMEVRGFCFKDALQVGGSADDGRLVQARVSLGGVGCRRRALVLDQWSLGCGPGQRTIGDAFISSVRVSVYCDFQSHVAIGLLLIRGRRRRTPSMASSGGRGIRGLEDCRRS